MNDETLAQERKILHDLVGHLFDLVESTTKRLPEGDPFRLMNERNLPAMRENFEQYVQARKEKLGE